MKKQQNISPFVATLKSAILHSQYKAVRSVNVEMVQLYFVLGAAISKKVKQANWGDKVLQNISKELQKELKGLRGFSHQNLKKMRQLYEAYPFMLSYCELALELGSKEDNKQDLLGFSNPSSKADDLGSTVSIQLDHVIGSALPIQLKDVFWRITISNHFLIINAVKTIEEQSYYIIQTAENSWSSRVLKNHLKNKIHKQKQLSNNFSSTLSMIDPSKAMAQFKDEYLLDFLDIEDADHERMIENKVVQNIKDFILHMGKGFSFIGNQYRLEVKKEEFFIDLLFFNRNIQALVAIELKQGKFRPEHLGQLSFYLNVLDDKVKLDHENPSIGIVLCKEKSKSVVEYALRNNSNPMGVATFKTKQEMPAEIKRVLPSVRDLKRLLNDND